MTFRDYVLKILGWCPKLTLESTIKQQKKTDWLKIFIVISALAIIIPVNLIYLSHLPYMPKPQGSIKITRSENQIQYQNHSKHISYMNFNYGFDITWNWSEKFVIRDKVSPNLTISTISKSDSDGWDGDNVHFLYDQATGNITITIDNPHTYNNTNAGVWGGFVYRESKLFANIEPTYYYQILNKTGDKEYDYKITLSSFELLNKTGIKTISLWMGISAQDYATHVDTFPYTPVNKATNGYAIWNVNTSLLIQEEHYVSYHVKLPLISFFSPNPLGNLQVTYSKNIYFFGSPTVEGGTLNSFLDGGVTYDYRALHINLVENVGDK